MTERTSPGAAETTPRTGPSPGPWTAAPDDGAGCWIVAADGHHIALVTPLLIAGDHAQDPKADAAMMAAAPLMAEALRRLLLVYQATFINRPEQADAWNAAVVALARSQGQEAGKPPHLPAIPAALALIEEAAGRVVSDPRHDVAVAAALELARRALVGGAP